MGERKDYDINILHKNILKIEERERTVNWKRKFQRISLIEKIMCPESQKMAT